jgi:hypothetical protein
LIRPEIERREWKAILDGGRDHILYRRSHLEETQAMVDGTKAWANTRLGF